ncbi:hypothetical protein EVAR_29341_1 [Eumeta japonica]|uniref:Uncharacterized protein n=1 Tax=Eumeta variegata TaxID=151549 RepID=A0A4C1WJB0_EUMVA|nr:hypothetical protein EVAR_29341_1 [Eumeta japonica]
MRRAQARQSYIFRYVVILLCVYWRKVTRARRTASADWWITPGTAGMRPRDLFTTSRDYRESVGQKAVKFVNACKTFVCGVDDHDMLNIEAVTTKANTIHRDAVKCIVSSAYRIYNGGLFQRRGHRAYMVSRPIQRIVALHCRYNLHTHRLSALRTSSFSISRFWLTANRNGFSSSIPVQREPQRTPMFILRTSYTTASVNSSVIQ